jgi:hypothetical protein
MGPLEVVVLLAMYAQPAVPDPLVVDLPRFPSREEANQAMSVNLGYQATLRFQLGYSYWRDEELSIRLRDASYRYHCWDWLHAARGGEGMDETYWRKSLETLRSLLGDEAYMAGQMPYPIPAWAER